MRSGQCRWRCPFFVGVPSVGASLCLSFRLGVGAQKKPPVKEAFWLWIYGAQNEAYMSRSAEKWVRGLCFNELGVCG